MNQTQAKLNESFALTSLEDVLTAVNHGNAETTQILKTISNQLHKLVKTKKGANINEADEEADEEVEEEDDEGDDEEADEEVEEDDEDVDEEADEEIEKEEEVQLIDTKPSTSHASQIIKNNKSLVQNKKTLAQNNKSLVQNSQSADKTELLTTGEEEDESCDSRFDPLTRVDWPAKGQKWTEYDLKQYFINYLYNNLARKYHLAKYRTLSSESSASDLLN